jgi:hypothetical protein
LNRVIVRRLFVLWSCLVVAPLSFALNARSAVSLAGVDTNPCTPASPCRSFGVAMAATAAGGEIIALDSGGYGPFTINQAVTISGAPGVHAAITATSGNGIFINAASSDTVILRNLVLIGGGALYGIDALDAGEVDILNCLARGFNGYGIYCNTSAALTLLIDNTGVFDSSGGIYLAGDGTGASFVSATVSNSAVQSNGEGVYSDYSTRLVLTHSTVTGSGDVGVLITSTSNTGLSASATVEGCTIAHNGTAVFVGAAGANNSATVTLSQNMLAFNANGVTEAGAGLAYSFGNNRFAGNSSDGAAMSASVLK